MSFTNLLSKGVDNRMLKSVSHDKDIEASRSIIRVHRAGADDDSVRDDDSVAENPRKSSIIRARRVMSFLAQDLLLLLLFVVLIVAVCILLHVKRNTSLHNLGSSLNETLSLDESSIASDITFTGLAFKECHPETSIGVAYYEASCEDVTPGDNSIAQCMEAVLRLDNGMLTPPTSCYASRSSSSVLSTYCIFAISSPNMNGTNGLCGGFRDWESKQCFGKTGFRKKTAFCDAGFGRGWSFPSSQWEKSCLNSRHRVKARIAGKAGPLVDYYMHPYKCFKSRSDLYEFCDFAVPDIDCGDISIITGITDDSDKKPYFKANLCLAWNANQFNMSLYKPKNLDTTAPRRDYFPNGFGNDPRIPGEYCFGYFSDLNFQTDNAESFYWYAARATRVDRIMLVSKGVIARPFIADITYLERHWLDRVPGGVQFQETSQAVFNDNTLHYVTVPSTASISMNDFGNDTERLFNFIQDRVLTYLNCPEGIAQKIGSAVGRHAVSEPLAVLGDPVLISKADGTVTGVEKGYEIMLTRTGEVSWIVKTIFPNPDLNRYF